MKTHHDTDDIILHEKHFTIEQKKEDTEIENSRKFGVFTNTKEFHNNKQLFLFFLFIFFLNIANLVAYGINLSKNSNNTYEIENLKTNYSSKFSIIYYEGKDIEVLENVTQDQNIAKFSKHYLVHIQSDENNNLNNHTIHFVDKNVKFDLPTFFISVIFFGLSLLLVSIWVIQKLKKNCLVFVFKNKIIQNLIFVFVLIYLNIQISIFRKFIQILQSELNNLYTVPYLHTLLLIYYTIIICSELQIHALSITISTLIIYLFSLGYDWSYEKDGISIFVFIIPYLVLIYYTNISKKKMIKKIENILFNLDISRDFKDNLCIGIMEITKNSPNSYNQKFIQNIKFLIAEYNYAYKLNELNYLKIIFSELDYKTNEKNKKDENRISEITSKIKVKIEKLMKEAADQKLNFSKTIFTTNDDLNFIDCSEADLPLVIKNGINSIKDFLFQNIIFHKFTKFATKFFIGRFYEFYIRKNKYSSIIEIIILENNESNDYVDDLLKINNTNFSHKNTNEKVITYSNYNLNIKKFLYLPKNL